MKLLILVLSKNDGDIYSNFYKSQKETWDSIDVPNVNTYYYFGNSNTNRIIGNEIHTTIKESFKNCGYKLIESLKMIQNMDYDFIFRTNSSSYIDKQMLYNHLLNIKNSIYYAGVNGSFQSINFASGSGFVLTKKLVKILLENSQTFNHNLIDDVAVGEMFMKHNIPLNHSDRFDILSEIENIPNSFYHYRLKSNDRYRDISNMYRIHNTKFIN